MSVAGVKRSSKDKSHFHESSYIYSNSTPHARSVLSTRNDASGTARLVPRVQGRRQWMGQRWSPSCACGGVARRTEEEEGSRRRRGSSSSSRRPEATNRPSGPRLRVTLPRSLGDCCFDCRRATLPSTSPLLFALQQPRTSPLHHPVCKPRAPAIRVARCPTDGVYGL